MKALLSAALLLSLTAASSASALEWQARDNGKDIAWDDAKAYCAGKGSGWRLPEIAELDALYGGQSRHGTGPWLWSATEVSPEEASDSEDVAWGLSLANGARTQNLRPIAYNARALCVRGSDSAAETLEIDQTHSAVLFSWNHIGISHPAARFEKIQGHVRLDRGQPSRSQVSVTLPLDGLRTGVEALDRRLKSADFLDAATYPAITFTSTAVRMTGPKRFALAGTLSIHGVTRPVVLDATVNAVDRNGFSDKLMAGFEADIVLRRSDFGVSRYAPAISDDLTVHITLHAEQPSS